MGASKVRVKLTPTGSGSTIEVNGHDFAAALRGIRIVSKVGEVTRAHLDLAVVELEGELTGEVTVHLTPAVRDALVALGWQPPAESDSPALASGATDNARSGRDGDPGAVK